MVRLLVENWPLKCMNNAHLSTDNALILLKIFYSVLITRNKINYCFMGALLQLLLDFL